MTSKTSYDQKYRLIDDDVYMRHVVHEIKLGDVDDPEIYLSQAFHTWSTDTEKGQWVMKHAKEITYHIHSDIMSGGYSVRFSGLITDRHWTVFVLKYADTDI